MFPEKLENKFSIQNISYKIEIFSLMYYFPQWISRQNRKLETPQDANRREWITKGLKNLSELGELYDNFFLTKATCRLIARFLIILIDWVW